MKAITLHQPWASAIMAGVKRWENRTWIPRELKTEPSLWLAIHAGKGTDTTVDLDEMRELWPNMPTGDWPRGLLGFACFDGAGHISVYPEARRDPWATGPNVWHVSQVLQLDKPIPLSGAQGIWTVDESIRFPLHESTFSIPSHFTDISAQLHKGPHGRSVAATVARLKWAREARGMTINEVESQLKFRHFMGWKNRCLRSIEDGNPDDGCLDWMLKNRKSVFTDYDLAVLTDLYALPPLWLWYGPHPDPRRRSLTADGVSP